MNGLLCIILCPVFAGIWAKMRQRPQGDWGMFTKTALGIIILVFLQHSWYLQLLFPDREQKIQLVSG